MDWMQNLHDILHGIQWHGYIMFHGLLDITLGAYKKVGLTQNSKSWQSLVLSLAPRNFNIIMVGTQTRMYVAVT